MLEAGMISGLVIGGFTATQLFNRKHDATYAYICQIFANFRAGEKPITELLN